MVDRWAEYVLNRERVTIEMSNAQTQMIQGAGADAQAESQVRPTKTSTRPKKNMLQIEVANRNSFVVKVRS